MRHYETPRPVEVTANKQPLTNDSLEPDTALVVGTRKLVAVMFILLRLPPIPSQESIDQHIAEVAADSEA